MQAAWSCLLFGIKPNRASLDPIGARRSGTAGRQGGPGWHSTSNSAPSDRWTTTRTSSPTPSRASGCWSTRRRSRTQSQTSSATDACAGCW